MAVERPHVRIRLARVIDVVGTIAATRAVQTPVAIDIANTQDATMARAFLRFEIRDSLARVFGNLPSASERNGGEATAAVDF